MIDFINSYLEKLPLKEKGFKPKKVKAYEQVELLVENEEYTKFDVHKGDIGTIMDDVAFRIIF